MAASSASYDQLLKQVEALKMENSNLRQELEDNSNHLTQLETEASSMKVHFKFCTTKYYLTPWVRGLLNIWHMPLSLADQKLCSSM